MSAKLQIEVSADEHKNIKVGAILSDMTVSEFLRAKIVEGLVDYAGMHEESPEAPPPIEDRPEPKPKRRGRPKGSKNKPRAYRMGGDGGWTDEAESDTPVTDSLTDDERERLTDALKGQRSYLDDLSEEEDGYEDDESEYESEHGVDEVDFDDD